MSPIGGHANVSIQMGQMRFFCNARYTNPYSKGWFIYDWKNGCSVALREYVRAAGLWIYTICSLLEFGVW